MKYKSISGNEAQLLALAQDNGLTVFKPKDIEHLSRWSKTRIRNTLYTLKKKKLITSIKRNHYTPETELRQNPYRVVTEAVKPSYISYWTALSHYGYTEQQVKAIQLVSTQQEKPMKLGPHTIEVTTLKPSRFYGYTRTDNYAIAEKEKTLVDSLHKPGNCGGLDEYIKCLTNAWKEVNKDKLTRYFIRFRNKSLNSRIGYLIEELRLGDARKLLKHKSKGYVKLDPTQDKTSEYSRRWRINVNHEIKRRETR